MTTLLTAVDKLAHRRRRTMKTISVKKFLSEIKPVISIANTSIQGFVITTRTAKSTIQIKWGSNRIIRFRKNQIGVKK